LAEIGSTFLLVHFAERLGTKEAIVYTMQVLDHSAAQQLVMMNVT
jgi:hypothetical protein